MIELLRNRGGEEEMVVAAAEGRGKAVGNEVGREVVEPGDRLKAVASLLGNVPRILILEVLPERTKEGFNDNTNYEQWGQKLVLS